MSDIENIYQKYRDQGLLVYGLHGGESAQLLAGFAEQTGISYPIVAAQGTLNKFSFPPGVGYPFPRDVIVGKDLVVRSIKNSFSADDAETLIKQLLAQ